MLLLRQPTPEQIHAFLEAQRDAPFSYAAVGASQSLTSKSGAPAGFVVDHNRIRLGSGRAVFERAVGGVQSWQMFNLGWVRLFFADTPIATGREVAVLARHLGFYSLNTCRIVYTLDESRDEESHIRRYGFAYGTLAAHAERGEERFSIEWHRADDAVWYDILAFSRPHHWLAAVGYPLTRQFQKRFARDSKRAMFDYVNKVLPTPV